MDELPRGLERHSVVERGSHLEPVTTATWSGPGSAGSLGHRRIAYLTALRLADHQKIDSHHVELATVLVMRGSTAPVVPPAGAATSSA